jgi:hypothetical protein
MESFGAASSHLAQIHQVLGLHETEHYSVIQTQGVGVTEFVVGADMSHVE